MLSPTQGGVQTGTMAEKEVGQAGAGPGEAGVGENFQPPLHPCTPPPCQGERPGAKYIMTTLQAACWLPFLLWVH